MQEHTILDARHHYLRYRTYPNSLTHIFVSRVCPRIYQRRSFDSGSCSITSDFLEAYVNLGAILKDVGRLNESVKAYVVFEREARALIIS